MPGTEGHCQTNNSAASCRRLNVSNVEVLEFSEMSDLDITVLNDSSRPVSKIAGRLEPYLRVLLDEFNPQQVILFGSYAYGEPSEHSDVDLLVIKPLHQSTLQEALAIRKKWRPLMRRKDRLSIELVLQSPEQHAQRLARAGAFYTEINAKGLRLA
jgi:predicted nucleotidyltransferase